MDKTTKTSPKTETKAASTIAPNKLSVDPKQIARREADAKKRKVINAAKAAIQGFTTDPAFSKLPGDVQAAMILLTKKGTGGGGVGNTANSLNNRFNAMFPKIGAKKSIIDIFTAEKWGVAECRNKVREALLKAAPEARMWIDYDGNETWTLAGIGAVPPKGYSLTVPKKIADQLAAK